MVLNLFQVNQFTKKEQVLAIAVRAQQLCFVQGCDVEQLKVHCSNMFRKVKTSILKQTTNHPKD